MICCLHEGLVEEDLWLKMNHLLSSLFVGGTAVASVYYTTLAFGKNKDKTNQNTYQKLTFYITNK